MDAYLQAGSREGRGSTRANEKQKQELKRFGVQRGKLDLLIKKKGNEGDTFVQRLSCTPGIYTGASI